MSRPFYTIPGETGISPKSHLEHYHRRSLSETTFMMIKAKFGAALRSKTDTAQVNELLCKVLCHNLCVVIQSMFDARHFAAIERAVNQYYQVLRGLTQWSIESFSRQGEDTVRAMFAHFERVLGPVGDSPQMRQVKRMPVRQSCGRASTRDRRRWQVSASCRAGKIRTRYHTLTEAA